MHESEIVSRIQDLYPTAAIDAVGEDCSFEVYVVDGAFEGMNTLQRQRPILALFSAELATGKLHALTVKARTPGEVNQQSGLVQIKF